MTPVEADAAVARGARVLDERGPAGWRETVTLAIKCGQLNMDLGEFEGDCGCVLAHTHGDYWDALDELFTGYDDEASAWAIAHGFTLARGSPKSAWDDLAAAWARLLGVEVPA